MIEQEHHKKAFEFYYSLGEKRNLQQVASESKVSIGSVKLWSGAFNWQHKISQRDASVAREIAARVIGDEISSRNRNTQIVHIALVQLAKAIAEGKVRMSLSDLDKLVRLEGYLHEKPKHELVSSSLGLMESLIPDMTEEEMRDRLKEQLAFIGWKVVETEPEHPPAITEGDCDNNHK